MDDSWSSSWFLVVFLYQLQTGLSLSGNSQEGGKSGQHRAMHR